MNLSVTCQRFPLKLSLVKALKDNFIYLCWAPYSLKYFNMIHAMNSEQARGFINVLNTYVK